MKLNGFSLVELLVSIGIWLTLLTVIFQFNSQYRQAYRNYLRLTSDNMACSDLLEKTVAMSFQEAQGQQIAPGLKSVPINQEISLYKYAE